MLGLGAKYKTEGMEELRQKKSWEEVEEEGWGLDQSEEAEDVCEAALCSTLLPKRVTCFPFSSLSRYFLRNLTPRSDTIRQHGAFGPNFRVCILPRDGTHTLSSIPDVSLRISN